MVKSVAYSTSLLFFFLHLCSLSLPVIVFLANVITVVAVVVVLAGLRLGRWLPRVVSSLWEGSFCFCFSAFVNVYQNVLCRSLTSLICLTHTQPAALHPPLTHLLCVSVSVPVGSLLLLLLFQLLLLFFVTFVRPSCTIINRKTFIVVCCGAAPYFPLAGTVPPILLPYATLCVCVCVCCLCVQRDSWKLGRKICRTARTKMQKLVWTCHAIDRISIGLVYSRNTTS